MPFLPLSHWRRSCEPELSRGPSPAIALSGLGSAIVDPAGSSPADVLGIRKPLLRD